MKRRERSFYVSDIKNRERLQSLTERVIATIETPDRLRQRISGEYQLSQIEKLLAVLEASIPPVVIPDDPDAPPVAKPALINLTSTEVAAINISLQHRQKLLDRRIPALKQQEGSTFEDESTKKKEIDPDDVRRRIEFLVNKARNAAEDRPVVRLDPPEDAIPEYLT